MIEKPKGKLGVLLVGLGSVSTTFIAGVEAVKKKWGEPYGSLTQLQTIQTKKSKKAKAPLIKDYIPLAKMADFEYLAWDIFTDNGYQAALKAGVLNKNILDKVRPSLEKIKPKKAVFNQRYVKRLNGLHVKGGKNWWEKAEWLKKDIINFQKEKRTKSLVMVWCASTEIYLKLKPVHQTLAGFEKGLKENDLNISPSMVYAYAAISLGIPFINATPNLTVDVPALQELAKKNKVPVAGKDLKTGQSMIKTIIAPGLKTRMLGVKGWFSNNILGNRDGEVLDDPDSFKTKEESKLSVLDTIFDADIYPELYQDLYHKIRINYYPPAGDNKEGWDNIDIFGWLGYPMQLKINFLCRDSILAAPIVLDLVLLMDLAKRAGLNGIQDWLSFYFKSPMVEKGKRPEHNLFAQYLDFKNALRIMKGEKPIDKFD